ncbi:tetratricopeptide repeat protein, partial [bacterium]|nr:tetratricopeptide repeat protein [bacterium]
MPAEGGTNIVQAARLYDKARQAIESEQYNYAISLFRSALGLDPNFTKAREGLKVARMKKFQSGSEFGRKMRGILFMIQAFVYEKLRRWNRAAEKYEELFAVVPPQIPILPHLGDVYWERGTVSEAINTYKTVLGMDENDLYTLRKLGDIYLEQEMKKEARHYYEKFIALKPEDVEISRELKNLDALLTIDKGGWEEDTTFIEKTVDRAEAREEAKKKEEELRKEKGEEVSVEKPREARIVEGIDIEALFKQAETFMSQNRIDDATNQYKKIVEADPDNARAHQALGEIYIQGRYFDQAIEEYEKVIEADPENKAILDSLANLHIRKGEIDKAIEKYERISALDPENAVTHKV